MTTAGRLLRTPLLWFVLAGAGLFALDMLHQSRAGQTITITAGDVQRLRAQWATQTGEVITRDTLAGLVDELILERRLGQEARALGLDRDDIVVQRRLAQKMRFLTEGLADQSQVSEADLVAFFRKHSANYWRADRFTFHHVFLDRQKRGVDTEADSEELLRTLRRSTAAQWQGLGDAYILGRSFNDRSADEITKVFGNDFLEQLTQQNPGNWQGPLQSDSGLHLVFVDRHESSHLLTLADARDQVLYDYGKERSGLAFLRYQATLAEKYPLVMDVEL